MIHSSFIYTPKNKKNKNKQKSEVKTNNFYAKVENGLRIRRFLRYLGGGVLLVDCVGVLWE